MNGFRKNKGIIIELTSLLDIILIMLFWLMMNISNSASEIEKKAQEKIDQANAKVQQAQVDADKKVSEAQDDAKKQIDRINEQNKQMRQDNVNMQNALDGFSNGKMVTVEMKYQDSHDVIYVSQNGSSPEAIAVDDKLSENLSRALNSYGLDKDSIILAAFMYDGDTVLYRDVNTVQNVLGSIKGNYKNIYFTQINTTK